LVGVRGDGSEWYAIFNIGIEVSIAYNHFNIISKNHSLVTLGGLGVIVSIGELYSVLIL
jgi:hypothetical protein